MTKPSSMLFFSLIAITLLLLIGIAKADYTTCPYDGWMYCSGNNLYWCAFAGGNSTLLTSCTSTQVCIAYNQSGSIGGGCTCPYTSWVFCQNNQNALWWCPFASQNAQILQQCLGGQTCYVVGNGTSGGCAGTPTQTTSVPANFTGLVCNPSNSHQILTCSNGVCSLWYDCGLSSTCSGVPPTCSAAVTAPPQSITAPIPAINQTEFQMTGYGWVLPLFSPMFIYTVIMAVFAGVGAKLGGPTVGGIAALAFIFVFTVFGIYPAWVGVILILVGGFVFVKFGTSILG
jgi:hypothetical protein